MDQLRERPPRASDPRLPNMLAESAGDGGGRFIATEDVPGWLAECARANVFAADLIPFREMRQWGFEAGTGNLVHDSGRFFSFEGLHVQTDYGPIPDWTQPIMYQPERGLLGLLVREFDGVLHFLMQAKMEPGNINLIQLSPTVQATKSNYTGVHKGTPTRYLDQFLGPSAGRVLLDALQSEQGDSFYQKRNRNMIVEATGDVPESPDFRWLTLGQINALLRYDHLVNMDTRTVLACLPVTDGDDPGIPGAPFPYGGPWASGSRWPALEASLWGGQALSPLADVLHWFTDAKSRYQLRADRIPLAEVHDWERSEDEIRHVDGRFFSVVGVSVQAGNREVTQWYQPLYRSAQPGVAALLVKEVGGVLHALMQAKLQPGHVDAVEIAPTLQCVTGGYQDVPVEVRPPYFDYVLSAPAERIRYDAELSEEGGRFYHRINRYMIVDVGDYIGLDAPPDYTWMTFAQIKALIKHSTYFDMEARTLITCLQSLY
jgi:oxidase EvaA